jgi:hypothetical protein
MILYRRVFSTLALAMIAGCNSHGEHFTLISGGSTSIDNGAITLHNDNVRLHPDHGPAATIESGGNFAVDGKTVPVTSAQRALLQQYYLAAAAVRQHGIETGKAGAGIAGAAIKGAVSSIAGNGDPATEDQVQAQADKVNQAAMKICDDLAHIRTAQDQLATQLPAFKPYRALITAGSVDECRKDNDD